MTYFLLNPGSEIAPYHVKQFTSGELLEDEPDAGDIPIEQMPIDGVPLNCAHNINMERLMADTSAHDAHPTNLKTFECTWKAVRSTQVPGHIMDPEKGILVSGWENMINPSKTIWTHSRWHSQADGLTGDAEHGALAEEIPAEDLLVRPPGKPDKGKGRKKPISAVEKTLRATGYKPPKATKDEKEEEQDPDEEDAWTLQEIVTLTVIAWITFFCVPKGGGVLRAICNAKWVNELFKRPSPVNLADPPRAAKLAAAKIGRLARPRKKKRGGYTERLKIWIVSLDWRHYFHQIPICWFLQKFFSYAIRKHMRERYFRWLGVPMGWSHAPYVAQCMGWHFIAHKNEAFPKDTMQKNDAPPNYLMTVDDEGNENGMAMLYYDNVHGYFTSKAAAEKFLGGVLRNMSWYNVQLKYAYLDGVKVVPDVTEADKYEDIKVSLDYDVQFGPQPLPDALGIEFWSSEKVSIRWRLMQSKINGIRKTPLDRTTMQTPRSYAKAIGRVLYSRLLSPLVNGENKPLLDLLSKVGKYQYRNGGWDATDFGTTVDDEEWGSLESAYHDFLRNPFREGEPLTTSRRKVFLATDASDEGWGWILYKRKIVDDQFPQKPPPRSLSPEDKGTSWDAGTFSDLAKRHIYLKEVFAAQRAIRQYHALHKSEGPVEYVVGIDNTAAKASFTRGLSINDQANAWISKTWKEVQSNGSTITMVGVPGHYNIADYPSRPSEFVEPNVFPPGMVDKKQPSRLAYQNLETKFDPYVMTWEVMRKDYLGIRLDIPPCEEARDRKLLKNPTAKPPMRAARHQEHVDGVPVQWNKEEVNWNQNELFPDVAEADVEIEDGDEPSRKKQRLN